MSGGSWDYVYYKFSEVGDRLCCEKDPLRRALGKKVSALADVMKIIEWVDSHDMSSPEDTNAIKDFLGDHANEEALAVLIEDGRKLVEQLKEFGV
jgi:hypothetical protein